MRWRQDPPAALRRLSREDQYLAEGMWHVRRRNEAWRDGDIGAAWRENQILEAFFDPVLDARSYEAPAGSRWPPEQRADAESRDAGVDRGRASDANPYPLYPWPQSAFWAAALLAAALLAVPVRPGARS